MCVNIHESLSGSASRPPPPPAAAAAASLNASKFRPLLFGLLVSCGESVLLSYSLMPPL